ncbi:MAG TPA: type II toxin-antitoxin system RelE/ParE family toxin [Desulfuromonadales bacterium]|nr:type II toxin-antitoxin system RelE/ParE family toxin [Desulfuromonadales bacterium]
MFAQFKVEISASAERDLEEIWDYITQDNPGNATSFILRLEEHIYSQRIINVARLLEDLLQT